MNEEERLQPAETAEKPAETKEKNTGFELYQLLRDMVYTLVAVTIVFVFIMRMVSVDGSSMYPTLHHADYLALLSSTISGDPEPGDIVVMTVPYYENEPIVKRVIATEGQTVDIDFNAGVVYVDGVALDEPYTYEPTYVSYQEIGQGLEYPVTVPEGHIFVLGDNRNGSSDSRFAPVGMVDVRDVLGKVLCILLPGADETTGERDWSRIGGVS